MLNAIIKIYVEIAGAEAYNETVNKFTEVFLWKSTRQYAKGGA